MEGSAEMNANGNDTNGIRSSRPHPLLEGSIGQMTRELTSAATDSHGNSMPFYKVNQICIAYAPVTTSCSVRPKQASVRPTDYQPWANLQNQANLVGSEIGV
jgi:hypothetical protein